MNVLTVRDLAIDLDRCEVRRGERRIHLSPTEFRIIAHLGEHPGKVFSAVSIMRAVSSEEGWGECDAGEALKVWMRRIRRKIEDDPARPTYLVNTRGFGYMLEDREPVAAIMRAEGKHMREKGERKPAANHPWRRWL